MSALPWELLMLFWYDLNGKAIRVYNNKGLFKEIESVFGISNYSKKAIEYLKEFRG